MKKITTVEVSAVQVVAKLTLVSVIVNGRRVSEFVQAEFDGKKARVKWTVIEEMTARAQGRPLQRGQTFSIG